MSYEDDNKTTLLKHLPCLYHLFLPFLYICNKNNNLKDMSDRFNISIYKYFDVDEMYCDCSITNKFWVDLSFYIFLTLLTLKCIPRVFRDPGHHSLPSPSIF